MSSHGEVIPCIRADFLTKEWEARTTWLDWLHSVEKENKGKTIDQVIDEAIEAVKQKLLEQEMRSNSMNLSNLSNPVYLSGGIKNREQCRPLFEKSGLLEENHLGHNPFIVISSNNTCGQVTLAYNARQVLDSNFDATVLVLWPGVQRSDYFHFRVIDLMNYLIDHPSVAQTIKNQPGK